MRSFNTQLALVVADGYGDDEERLKWLIASGSADSYNAVTRLLIAKGVDFGAKPFKTAKDFLAGSSNQQQQSDDEISSILKGMVT